MSKNGHGGKRDNAGRKQAADKKRSLWLYIEGSHIDAVGGEPKAKAIATQAVIAKSNRLQKELQK